MIPDSNLPHAALLYNLDLVSTILSTIASVWMVYSCFKLPSPKNTSLKLIMAVAVADLFYSFANIMSNFQTPGNDDFCIFEAYVRQAAFLLSMFFSTCIAIASYKISALQINSTRNSFFAYSLLIGVVLCALQFGIPYSFHFFISINRNRFFFSGDEFVVSRGPFFCWLTHDNDSSKTVQLMVIMFYKGFFIILGLIITICSYILVIKKTKELPAGVLTAVKFNYYYVLWYPAVFFLTFAPNLLDNILRIYYPGRPVWLQAAHLVLTHSVGFSNALVYGVQRKILKTNYEENARKFSEFETSIISLSSSSMMY